MHGLTITSRWSKWPAANKIVYPLQGVDVGIKVIS
jgi:hypothetical protein